MGLIVGRAFVFLELCTHRLQLKGTLRWQVLQVGLAIRIEIVIVHDKLRICEDLIYGPIGIIVRQVQSFVFSFNELLCGWG
jgi:hypothetical protein